jgi:ABC-2 type transport system ATP-binding protein
VAVQDVSFEVATGEIFGVLGPNGSGKTTTVECVQGLRRADAGHIRVLGLDPQTHAMTCVDGSAASSRVPPCPTASRSGRPCSCSCPLAPGAVDWSVLLERWGLAATRNANFASLSGGQRQRLFVALALVNQPEVVFLDKITTGLDPPPAARPEG